MSGGTILSWFAWLFVILKISPNDSGLWGIFAFYFSLFLSIVGTFSVIGFLVRKVMLHETDIIFKHVKNTFRQSILLGSAIVFLLFLLSRKWFFWWTALSVILLFIFIEAAFYSVSRNNLTDNNVRF